VPLAFWGREIAEIATSARSTTTDSLAFGLPVGAPSRDFGPEEIVGDVGFAAAWSVQLTASGWPSVGDAETVENHGE
jgi:hypothetical protein